MARALNAGPIPTRRRALFGLLDADGWGWASVKAFAWPLIIIFLLGYLPDRAYYFTVGRTLDLGILAFSPVNFCPPENGEGYPCPPPHGGVTAWQPAPQELALPQPTTDGALVQVGTRYLFIGGSNGTTATDAVYVATAVETGSFDRWEQGPALPEPRADAGVAFFGGSIYVVGGRDGEGAPTTTTYVLTPDAEGGLGEWQEAAGDETAPLELPEGRAGGALIALADGLAYVGGSNEQGPTATVWKATLDEDTLTAWAPQPGLVTAVTDPVGVQTGNYLWVYGGTESNGQPTGLVQRSQLGSGEQQGQLLQWGVRDVGNLPEARSDAAGFAANGTLYLIGGSDGTRPRGELYWATPTADPDLGEIITEWHHLGLSDLPPQGLTGGAALAAGSTAFVMGGETADGIIAGGARTNLAPQAPFFQLGLVGATVPGLKIDGEIGQQLGYLNAAGVGTVNFILLLLIGWAFAHREQTRELFRRVTRRR